MYINMMFAFVQNTDIREGEAEWALRRVIVCYCQHGVMGAIPAAHLCDSWRDSLLPGWVGLQRSFDHFAYFAMVLFTTMMLVEGLMMIVASSVPDILMGIITGAGIQGIMMLNGGFFRLPHNLPKTVWRYPMYYIAFHKYANQGFYKNEFMGLTFPNNQAGDAATIIGGEILRDYW
jgi:hypothetical protein